MKERKLVIIDYICDYCRMPYRNREKAIRCEASHILIGVGSVIFYMNEYYDRGPRHARHEVRISGTIVKVTSEKFLIENSDGTRLWRETWEVYRTKQGDINEDR